MRNVIGSLLEIACVILALIGGFMISIGAGLVVLGVLVGVVGVNVAGDR